MALSTAVITFNIADMIGTDFDARRTKAWTSTNVENDTLIDTSAGQIRLGDGRAAIGTDGTGSFTVWVPGDGANPASWQTSFHFDYVQPGTRERKIRTFGPFTLTGSADLTDLEAEQAIPGTLDTTALVDRISSLTRARADYTSSAAGQFTEAWTDLTAWSPSAGSRAQVNAGRLYSKAAGGGAAINHAFTLAAGDKARAVVDLHYELGATGGGIILGVSAETAGSDGASGGAGISGLYFLQSGEVRTFDKGATVSLGSMTATTDLVCTITVDETYVSVTARADGDSSPVEWRARFTRASVGTINNLALFNNDTRASAGTFLGSWVGPVKARKALSTVTPRTGLEDVTASVEVTKVTGVSGGTADVRVALPKGYDSRRAYPLALCFHGNGGTEKAWAPPRTGANPNQYDTAEALLTAGYIVVSAGYTNVSNWGAQAGIDVYTAAYEWVRDHYSVGPVTLWANSMGGIESLNLLAQRDLPGIVAWIGHSPSANLAAVYADATYTALVKTAYGIAADGSDYAAKTAGHDPALMAATAFRRVPMFFIYAQDDTSIPPANHAIPFITKVTGTATEVVVKNPATGGHGVAIAPYLAEAIAFANKYTGN